MTVYDLIAEMRREAQAPAVAHTLDMLVVELGNTRDNVREAVSNLKQKPLPQGGQQLLERLLRRAEHERVDDLYYPPGTGGRVEAIPLDDGTAGIGLLLGIFALLAFGATLAALIDGLNKIFHWF